HASSREPREHSSLRPSRDLKPEVAKDKFTTRGSRLHPCRKGNYALWTGSFVITARVRHYGGVCVERRWPGGARRCRRIGGEPRWIGNLTSCGYVDVWRADGGLEYLRDPGVNPDRRFHDRSGDRDELSRRDQ